jgi:hypothetical protein
MTMATIAQSSVQGKVVKVHESDSSCANKLSSYNYSNIILVLAGSEERHFFVHADVICVKSKFFRAACSDRWKEGQEKLIHLPEVELRAFQRYVDWTYGDAIVAEPILKDALYAAIDMYMLGDMLDDVRLRNKATKAFHRHLTIDYVAPATEGICRIWENSPPNSLLGKLTVDVVVEKLGSDTFEDMVEGLPAGFVQQVAVKLKHQATKTRGNVFRAKLAEYLEPEDGA